MRNAEGTPWHERGSIPAIVAFGSATGSMLMDNAAVDKALGKSDGTTERIIRVSGVGIKERYWVKPGEATSDLCVRAIHEALQNGHLDASALTQVLIATSSPDYLSVSEGAIVQYKGGLPGDISYKNIANACPGWVEAADVVTMSLSSPLGKGGVQMVVGADVISPFIGGKTYPLFGDGAGATVWKNVPLKTGEPAVLWFESGADGSHVKDLYIPAGGTVLPPSAETTANKKDDLHGLKMHGKIVFDNAVKQMAAISRKVFEHEGIPLEEVDLFFPHQANLAIIEAVAEELGIPMEKVVVTIDRFGNTSAASIPMAMHVAYAQGRLKRHQIVGVASFGAGLGYAGAALSMNGLPEGEQQLFRGVDVDK